MTAGKTIALTIWTFVSQVLSLLFNTLSRFVIAFLSRSKHLLISWLQLPSAVILEPKKIKFVCFPVYLPWSDETRCHDPSFLNVEDFYIYIFNWRITVLQNFVFCQTSTWISHRYTYIPSLLNFLSHRMLSVKAAFHSSSFTFIMRLFSSSSLSTIRMVSSPYLRLIILLPTILIPAYDSSSPAFLMMYSANVK